MLDPGLLKDNLEALKINILRRNLDVDIDFLINLNDEMVYHWFWLKAVFFFSLEDLQ